MPWEIRSTDAGPSASPIIPEQETHPMTRRALPLVLAMMLSLTLAAPVLGAAPSNDTYAGRTVIGSLPFSESLDTSEATTDADDDELNAQCGAPQTDASVWYELTPTSDAVVLVDVSGSDYPAGVLVGTGSPGSFSIVACGPGGAGFEALAGETYAILVLDDQSDGGGNGGTLTISVDEAPPPPAIDVTINPTGTFSLSGSATLSGTVVCDPGADFGFIEVQLRQRAGRVFIDGFGGAEVVCDGTVHDWTAEVIGNGLYKGGSATVTVFAGACNVFTCGDDFEQRTIKLHRR
jgi:hypothetical protein